jgi:hypothetical protein
MRRAPFFSPRAISIHCDADNDTVMAALVDAFLCRRRLEREHLRRQFIVCLAM